MDWELVYRDDWLLVVDKPSGLLAVPGRGPELQDCLVTRVQGELSTARIVHRLDRDTSGLLVLALDAETHRQLSWQFETRQVDKTYEALVAGCVVGDEGQIDLPLSKDFERPPRHRVNLEQGRAALTHWRVVARHADRTRLELSPVTGRSHQLRVHLAAVGHPICGDPLYADPVALSLADRLQLHAGALALVHPATGVRQSWIARCPF